MRASPRSDAIKVFISYSHDSKKHVLAVLQLANKLRNDGIDCMIDQYVMNPQEGWPKWMMNQINESKFTMVVCTRVYNRRFHGEEKPDTGKGVIWEGAIITTELYENQGKNDKFIPILFTEDDKDHRPDILKPWSYYIVGTKEGYESLYRQITGQPYVKKPKIGKRRVLKHLNRVQEFQTIDDIPVVVSSPVPLDKNFEQNWVVAIRTKELIGNKKVRQVEYKLEPGGRNIPNDPSSGFLGNIELGKPEGHWISATVMFDDNSTKEYKLNIPT